MKKTVLTPFSKFIGFVKETKPRRYQIVTIKSYTNKHKKEGYI